MFSGSVHLNHEAPSNILLGVLACALFFLLLPSTVLADEPPKNILLFNSDDISLPANALANQALRATLKEQSKFPLQIYDEGQDSFRIPNEKYESELVSLLKQKYEGTHLDLIVALGPPSLKFLLKHREDLFHDTPIVFLSSDQSRTADLDLGPAVTGVSTKIEVAPTLALALELQPQTRRVVVVAGSASLDQAMVALAQKEFRAFEGRVEFSYLTGLTVEELRQRLAVLPDKTIVLFIVLNSDHTGRVYVSADVLTSLASASSVPIYGTFQTLLGRGIVGGRLLSTEALGHAAGEMGLRILAGESAGTISQQTISSVPMFDSHQLHRWHIDESKLPPGSVVLFKEYSFWELYKWRVIGAISLMISQTLLIIWLLAVRTMRNRAQAESTRFAGLIEAEHRRLGEIVANVQGIVWESRLEPGSTNRKTTFVSSYAEKMLGYSVEEWLSKPGFALSLMPEEDRGRVEHERDIVVASGKEGISQFRWVAKDGRVIWIETYLAAICDEEQRTVGLRGISVDITNRKRAEEALRQALAEVSQLKSQLEEENVYLREEIKLSGDFDEIVGRSDGTKYVLYKIQQVAPTDSTVLITGETGTGKELVARAIHRASSRANRQLIKVNCGALSATLIESELFGHEKGSFTGATARKLGRFELANDGTILLDEIGELPLELQVKLLRVIQEGEFERLGSSKTIKVDVRIIASTNRDLKMAIELGRFREDLWYRLNVFPITIPPLRDRKEDIPDLLQHFTRRFSEKIGKNISSISPAVLKAFQEYSWPGNVRELANVIERAIINCDGPVLRLVDRFDKLPIHEAAANLTLEEMERNHIVHVLETTGWRIEGGKGAARILGLNPSTLRTRMAKLEIQRVDRGAVSVPAGR